MRKLISASGVIVHEEGDKLYISKIPAPWTATFVFVSGLSSLVFIVNGLIELFMLSEKGSTRIGLVLLSLGIFCVILLLHVLNFKRRNNRLPLHKLEVIAIFDFAHKNLLDRQHQILKPLSQIRITRRMQISSSSPELLIQWDGGSLRLAKGNPFSGGIEGIEQILISKGVKKG